jgi:hypothetical protein
MIVGDALDYLVDQASLPGTFPCVGIVGDIGDQAQR